MPYVMTVRGPISPEQLGVTICHTHLLASLQFMFRPRAEASKAALGDRPITMDLLGRLRRDPSLVKDNLILGDVDVAIEEVMAFKKNGGQSIVEVSPAGIGRDPIGLRQIANATGLNIICPTGWYMALSHPPLVKEKSIDQLADIMVKELTEGIGKTGIRAGMIGELAMSGRGPADPFQKEEEKVLRAAARAQARTGVALTVHPNYLGRHWDTYIDILVEEGANVEKCYMSHMEMYCPDVEYQQSILARGVHISYDQFGHEEYMDAIAPGVGFPPDRLRVDGLVALVKAGHANRIVLSNECAFKLSYRRYGGHGYGHLMENIVPELKHRGVSEAQLHTMLVENPARLLAVE